MVSFIILSKVSST